MDVVLELQKIKNKENEDVVEKAIKEIVKLRNDNICVYQNQFIKKFMTKN
jgi:hypothetical protein